MQPREKTTRERKRKREMANYIICVESERLSLSEKERKTETKQACKLTQSMLSFAALAETHTSSARSRFPLHRMAVWFVITAKEKLLSVVC